MDWKIFIASFTTIFIAEIGDKTQIAAFALSSQSNSIFSVLLGAILALSASTCIGVFLGSTLGYYVSPAIMKWVSGITFILIGIWSLLR